MISCLCHKWPGTQLQPPDKEGGKQEAHPVRGGEPLFHERSRRHLHGGPGAGPRTSPTQRGRGSTELTRGWTPHNTGGRPHTPHPVSRKEPAKPHYLKLVHHLADPTSPLPDDVPVKVKGHLHFNGDGNQRLQVRQWRLGLRAGIRVTLWAQRYVFMEHRGKAL